MSGSHRRAAASTSREPIPLGSPPLLDGDRVDVYAVVTRTDVELFVARFVTGLVSSRGGDQCTDDSVVVDGNENGVRVDASVDGFGVDFEQCSVENPHHREVVVCGRGSDSHVAHCVSHPG